MDLTTHVKGLEMSVETRATLMDITMEMYQLGEEQASTIHECDCLFCHRLLALQARLNELNHLVKKSEDEEVSLHFFRNPQ